MPFTNATTLFRIFGIRVQMHWTLLLLALLLTWSLSVGWFPQVLDDASPLSLLVLGLIGAFGLFASILLHELSHALVARRYQMPIDKITLFLFGGVAHMEDEPPTPKAEFWMAIAGPITSLALSAFAFGLVALTNVWGAPIGATALFSYFASINLAIAVFNLFPGFPLDGGRVLRAAIWHWKKDVVAATRVSAMVGQFFGFSLVALGIFAIFATGSLSGLWTVLIGGLIVRFARQSYVAVLVKQALRGAAVRHLMNPNPTMVTPDATIGEVMRVPPKNSDQLIYPVARDNQELVGFIDLRRTKDLPPAEWESHSIREFAEPLPKAIQVTPDTAAERALTKMNESGTSELMVVENNRLLGTISIQTLLHQVQVFLAGSPQRPRQV